MENLKDLSIEFRYGQLPSKIIIPNIAKKRYLTFTVCRSANETTTADAYRETFDLELARKIPNNIFFKRIVKNYSKTMIFAEINMQDNSFSYSGSNALGVIYTHNL